MMFNVLSVVFSVLCVTQLSQAQEPVPKSKIEAALQSLRTQAPSSVTPGQILSVDTTQSVAGGAPLLRAKETTTILRKSESTSQVSLYYYYDRVEYHNGFPTYQSQNGETTFHKNEPTIFTQLPDGYYSDLQISEDLLPTPEIVLHRKDCGGLKGCPKQLPTKKVSLRYRNYQGQWYSLVVWGSEIVPFLASPLKACESTTQAFGDHRVEVTTCRRVVDFTSY